jgi:hypothetical protein
LFQYRLGGAGHARSRSLLMMVVPGYFRRTRTTM